MAKSQTVAKRGKAAVAVTKRNRRPPAEVLAELTAKREAIATRLGARLAKLDARIARLEARQQHQVELAELTDGLSADELTRKLDEMRHMQKLLRLAIKTKA